MIEHNANSRPYSSEVMLRHYGNMPDETAISLCVLRSAHLEATICNFGARVLDLRMRGDDGASTSVVLGYPSLADYLVDPAYMGAIVGRYANRIAKGRFTMGSNQYQISQNDGENSLHGGRRGFDQRVWSLHLSQRSAILKYMSLDGEEGYPGALRATVRYAVSGCELQVTYEAQSTTATPVNLSNHMYFNLGGNFEESILGHVLTLPADLYTPVDAGLIPTGELSEVRGTPLDFRDAHAIGERIDADHPQLRLARGYDHNWVLSKAPGIGLAARVYEPRSRRQLAVYTSEPALQFYSGNQLGAKKGAPGRAHGFRCGFCLETQHFPDSPNHQNFPSTWLLPGETYRSETIYRLDSQTSS